MNPISNAISNGAQLPDPASRSGKQNGDRGTFSLRNYPTASEIISQAEGIPDPLRKCAQYMTDKGAGQARFCVMGREGDSTLFVLHGYYLSVLSDGTLLDGEDVLQEALTAGVIADDQDDEADDGERLQLSLMLQDADEVTP